MPASLYLLQELQSRSHKLAHILEGGGVLDAGRIATVLPRGGSTSGCLHRRRGSGSWRGAAPPAAWSSSPWRAASSTATWRRCRWAGRPWATLQRQLPSVSHPTRIPH